VFQEEYTGFQINYPELSTVYLNLKKLEDQSIILEQDIIQQYQDLQFLGNDILQDYFINDDVLEDLILFVNDNYLPINHYELMVENSRNVQLFGRMIYKLLIVDFINEILPNICKTFNYSIYDLLGIEEESLKEYLIFILNQKCELIKTLLDKAENNKELNLELLKYTFGIDLFDTNISNFITLFVQPVISLYEIEIDSKI
jgi:hypothetical protein